MATPTDENVPNKLLQQALAANQELMATQVGGKSYCGECKRYKKWLEKQTTLRQEPALSVENVETYFALEVANRMGKPSTVDKWVAGMQYYVDRAPKGSHLPAGFCVRKVYCRFEQ